jgi:hypothetical protein
VENPDQQRDFFVSYTQADRAWAKWLAWELEAAGFTTLLQAWDMPAGTAFVHAMDQAVQTTPAHPAGPVAGLSALTHGGG